MDFANYIINKRAKTESITPEREAELKQLLQDALKAGQEETNWDEELTRDEYKLLFQFCLEQVKETNDEEVMHRLCIYMRLAGFPFKVWNAGVEAIKAIVPKLSPQGRLYAYDFLASSMSSPDNADVWPLLLARIDAEESDKIKASIICFLNRCAQDRFGNDEKLKDVLNKCKSIIEPTSSYGPLTKIAAAYFLSLRNREEVLPHAISVSVDCVINEDKYVNLWNNEEAKALWAWRISRKAHQGIAEDDQVNLGMIATNALSLLDSVSVKEYVMPAFFEALKTCSNEDALSIVYSMLTITFDDPLWDGIFFAELEQTQRELLQKLSEIPSLNIDVVLKEYNIPSDLVKFINTPIPEDMVDNKMATCLDGLASVDWGKLGHAYGSAVDLPDMVRALAGRNPAKRQGAWGGMYSAPYHQGSRYSGTVAMAPFIIQLLECKRVEGKERLLEWLECCAIGWPQGYILESFDKKEFTNYEDHYNEDQNIRVNCYNEIEKGWPIYLQLILDENSSLPVILKAISLLSRFPNFSSEILSVLKSVHKNAATPVAVRATIIMAISHLSDPRPEEQAKLKAQLLPLCDAAVNGLATMTKEDKQLLLMETVALGRCFQPTENLPDSVKKILLHEAISPVEQLETGFGDSSEIFSAFMQRMGKQFASSLVEKLSTNPKEGAFELAMALISALFEEVNGGCFSDRQSEYFKLKVTDEQAKALDAIVDCDALWSLPTEQQRQLVNTLHMRLKIDEDPTRNSLRNSLARRTATPAEEPSADDDDN